MRDQITAKLKEIVRPLTRHRLLIERAKYIGTRILDAQEGNERIAEFVKQSRPMAAGKIGASELAGIRHYLRARDRVGHCAKWGRHAKNLFVNAGVYPPNSETFSRFCVDFCVSLGELNLLGVWFHSSENRIRRMYAAEAIPMALRALEPYYHNSPWTQGLTGKRVLVVSPFVDTIKKQFERRLDVWKLKPEVLGDFQLDTLRCPLSAGIAEPRFPDWFTALEAMKREMNERAFDVAIIGAGAWGIPLAVHAKSIGRIGIHMGGATQMLFGVRGGRWDKHPVLSAYFNDAWVRPGESDRPQDFRKIENGCYW